MVGPRQLVDILLVNENMVELVFYNIYITLVMSVLMMVVDTEELMVFRHM